MFLRFAVRALPLHRKLQQSHTHSYIYTYIITLISKARSGS